MRIIGSREFRANMAFFLSQAEKEELYVKRPHGKLLKIAPVSKEKIFGKGGKG